MPGHVPDSRVGALWSRRLQGVDPIKAAYGQLASSTLILLPLAGFFDQPWNLPMPAASTWLALLVCTALA